MLIIPFDFFLKAVIPVALKTMAVPDVTINKNTTLGSSRVVPDSQLKNISGEKVN